MKLIFILLMAVLGCKSTLVADKVICRDLAGEVMFNGEDCFFTAGNGVTCEKPIRQIYNRPIESVCTVVR